MTDRHVPSSQASTGQLIAQATDDISTLIRDEMELAKRDLAESGKRLGVGAGLFGVAGTLALYGLGALIATAILGIAEALDAWLAALIVAGALFVLAAVAGLIGKMRVRKVSKAPRQRVESVKADVAAVKSGASEGRPS
jgi:hypothetical protein